MREIRHTVPYTIEYVKAASFDIVETLSDDATAKKETWQLVGTMNVYGNKSIISLETEEVDDRNTDVCIKMVVPAKNLTAEGEKRALSFIADSIEQLLENTLIKVVKEGGIKV